MLVYYSQARRHCARVRMIAREGATAAAGGRLQ